MKFTRPLEVISGSIQIIPLKLLPLKKVKPYGFTFFCIAQMGIKRLFADLNPRAVDQELA
jgi:hypothetical protein